MLNAIVAGLLLAAGPARAGELQDLMFEGKSQHAMGRLSEAAFDYRKAGMVDNRAAEPHFNLGVALFQLGRNGEAAGELRRAIASGYTDPLAQVMLALASTDPSESREAYRAAVQQDASFADPAFDPDEALLKKGLLPKKAPRSQTDRARFAAIGGVGSAPATGNKTEDAASADLQGRAFEAQGKLEEAVAAYRKAVALSPDAAKYHGHLAAALSAQSEDRSLPKARTEDLRKQAAAEFAKASYLSLQ